MSLYKCLTVLVLFLYGCMEKNKYVASKTGFPVVISHCNNAEINRHEANMQMGSYYPVYIGEKKDTVLIDKTKHDITRFQADWRDGQDYHYPKDSSNFLITIDTARLICYTAKYYRGDSTYFKIYKGFPLIVSNNSLDTIRIGSGPYLPATLEALNPKGKWQPIEEKMLLMDENGLNRFFLPPKFIAVFAVPVYKGNFKTKLRIKYRDFTSAPFLGSINISQLDATTYGNNFLD